MIEGLMIDDLKPGSQSEIRNRCVHPSPIQSSIVDLSFACCFHFARYPECGFFYAA
jgi:hypothetical protein